MLVQSVERAGSTRSPDFGLPRFSESMYLGRRRNAGAVDTQATFIGSLVTLVGTEVCGCAAMSDTPFVFSKTKLQLVLGAEGAKRIQYPKRFPSTRHLLETRGKRVWDVRPYRAFVQSCPRRGTDQVGRTLVPHPE
jgi:hypothetical protein